MAFNPPLPRTDEDSPPLRRPTPAPWAAGLPDIPAPAVDTAKAFDELEAWLRANPSERSVWTIDRIKGKWRVGLRIGDERLSASQDQEIRGAIRSALMIAKFTGYV